MATKQEMEKLLSIVCPWCQARPRELCSTGSGTNRRPLRTLDGGCHDARWRAALGYEATVMTAVIEEQHAVRQPVDEAREPVSVGSAMPVLDRPW